MRVLLDTHCWLWWIAEPVRLADGVKSIIEDTTNEVYLSTASCWEIAIKWGSGKLDLPDAPELFVPSRLARDRILVLNVELAHALRVSILPPHHKDPFDRILIAQSQIEAIPSSPPIRSSRVTRSQPSPRIETTLAGVLPLCI